MSWWRDDQPESNIPKRYVRKDGKLVWVRCPCGACARRARAAGAFHCGDRGHVRAEARQRRPAEERRVAEFTLDAAGIGLCYRESGQSRPPSSSSACMAWSLPKSGSRANAGSSWFTPMTGNASRPSSASRWSRASLTTLSFVSSGRTAASIGFCAGERVLHADGGARKAEVTVDVTERKRAEAALEEFFGMSRSPMAILGFDGIQAGERRSLRGFGIYGSGIRPAPWEEFFHPDDRTAMQAEFRRLIAQGGDTEFECRGLCKDGSCAWLLFSATAVPDEKSIFTVAYDITERKLAEAALAEEALRRRTIFEQSQGRHRHLRP